MYETCGGQGWDLHNRAGLQDIRHLDVHVIVAAFKNISYATTHAASLNVIEGCEGIVPVRTSR